MNTVLLLTGLGVLATVIAFSHSALTDPDLKDVEELMEFLWKDRTPERYRPDSYFEKLGLETSSRLSAFSFKNCGDPSKETFILSQVSVSPDPVALPGNVTVGFSGTNKVLGGSPLKTVLLVKTKVFGVWIKVPCIGHMGSCTFDDFCEILAKINPCPEPVVKAGIPCHCPLKAGTYTLPPSVFTITQDPIPSGDYMATVNVTMKDTFIGCYEFTFSVA